MAARFDIVDTIDMPETSPAQGTLKRLIEAEEQAREIVSAAEERAQQSIQQAREQAGQIVEDARAQAAAALQSLLAEVQSKAETDLAQRLRQAEAEDRAFERRAQENFSGAAKFVVDWVTSGED